MSNPIVKNIPNIVTFSRIVFACVLLFSGAYSPLFFVMFTLCVISDVLDGYLARILSVRSKKGSNFDTFADCVTLCFTLWCVTEVIEFPVFVWIFIAIVAFIKCITAIIFYVKNKNCEFPHTIFDKLAGLSLTVCVYLLGFCDTFVVCMAGSIICLVTAIINLIRTLKRGAI